MHARGYIRNLVKAALLNQGDFGSHVTTKRTAVFALTELPAIKVIAGDEASEAADIHDQLSRELTCEVVIFDKQLDDIDAELDAHAVVVEESLDSLMDADAHDVIVDVLLTATSTEVDDESEQTAGQLTLTYLITYETQAGSPGIEL